MHNRRMLWVWQTLGEGLVCAQEPILHLSYSSHDWLQIKPLWAIMLMSHKSFKVAYVWGPTFCIIKNNKYKQAVSPKGMSSTTTFFLLQYSSVDVFYKDINISIYFNQQTTLQKDFMYTSLFYQRKLSWLIIIYYFF